MSEEKIHEHSHSHKKKDETIKFEVTKARLWQGISAILVIVILVMWFAGPIGQGTPQQVPTQVAPTPTQQQVAPEQVRQQVDVDDDPFLGDENAPVTIVEFSDFECPFCGRAFQQAVTPLKEEYIKTGKVKLVYRDFPLNFHPNAQSAAEASECADDQGKFWEYHDLLFANQQNLGSATYTQIAEHVGLDVEMFSSCLESGKHRQEVQSDFAYGSSVGVSGTPTFFINGIKLVGAQPYEALKQVIEAELNQ